jgi:hypothetical protein
MVEGEKLQPSTADSQINAAPHPSTPNFPISTRDLPGNFYRATGGRQVSRILHLPTARFFFRRPLKRLPPAQTNLPLETSRLKLETAANESHR